MRAHDARVVAVDEAIMLTILTPYGNSSFSLKLHPAATSARNTVTGYGAGFVAVNGTRFERSLVVLPQRVVTDWSATTFEALEAAQLAALVGLGADIVLLGTGNSIRFPRPLTARRRTSCRSAWARPRRMPAVGRS